MNRRGLSVRDPGARPFDCGFALCLTSCSGFAQGRDDGCIRSFGSAGVEWRVPGILDPGGDSAARDDVAV